MEDPIVFVKFFDYAKKMRFNMVCLCSYRRDRKVLLQPLVILLGQ